MSIQNVNLQYTQINNDDLDTNESLTQSKSDLTKIDEPKSLCSKIVSFFATYFFIVGLCVVLLIAFLDPSIGEKDGPLKPKITSSWIAVIIIFFMTGLMVRTTELKRASKFWGANILIESIVFILWPFLGWSIAMLLEQFDTMSAPLLDGLIITACLPTTLTSGTILTLNADGNASIATINAVLSNTMAVGLTPLLCFMILHNLGSVKAGDILYKITMRIIIPFLGGQIVRWVSINKLNIVVDNYKKIFKKIPETCLLFILFCGVSDSIYKGVDTKGIELVIVMVVCITLHLGLFVSIWWILKLVPFCNRSFNVSDRVAVCMLCSRKSLAFGLPMIETLFGDSDYFGIYSVPIIILLPTGLIAGSLMIQPLQKYVANDERNKSELGMSLKDVEMDTANPSDMTPKSHDDFALRL